MAPPAQGARPNVVVIQTDDQPAGTLTSRVMPRTHRLLVRPGTEFLDYVVTTPLCCPSRASLLTGQYGHNNGVLQNSYRSLRQKVSILPAWLWSAGYRTSHVGKYMNDFPLGDGPGSGWEGWATKNDSSYYAYRLHYRDRLRSYGRKPQDHFGRVVAQRAASEVHRMSGRRPFYLQADFPAPHAAGIDPTGRCSGEAVPDPRDRGAFHRASMPRPPSFDEEDTSDKPGFVAGRTPLSKGDRRRLRRGYRCSLASLRSVDRGVGRIVQALRRSRELEETAIVFVSDNGFFYGEHRIMEGKHFPYEEAIRVPMVLRPPAAMLPRAPATVSVPVANIDLAPTILGFARARPCSTFGRCRTMDGLSLLPVLRGRKLPPRDLLVEMDDPNPLARGKPCRYAGVRTPSRVYVEYELAEMPYTLGPCLPVREVEHYDLRHDPFQLDNLFPAAGGTQVHETEQNLATRLEKLRHCAGVKGRDPHTNRRPFCASIVRPAARASSGG